MKCISLCLYYFFSCFYFKPVFPGITEYSYSLLFMQRFFTVCTQRPQANKALCPSDGSVCGLESTFKVQASFKPPPAFTFYQALWNLLYVCDILLARNVWITWAHFCLCCTWMQPLVNWDTWRTYQILWLLHRNPY